jgi:hypothetical protein
MLGAIFLQTVVAVSVLLLAVVNDELDPPFPLRNALSFVRHTNS